MRLHLHRSNRTERLVEALAAVLQSPTGNPFARDAVVVHSRGLERWLSMRLADAHGICANVDFPFPNELIGQALDAALGPEGDLSAWSVDRLTWAVLAELNAAVDREEPAFAEVIRWARDDGQAHAQRRLTDLAGRVAGLFERYATYRPHEVRQWTEDSADWQQVLWARSRQRLAGAELADVAPRFEQAMVDGADLGDLPERICLFSVSTLPPLLVSLFGALARQREVHLFVLSPSQHFAEAVAAHRDSLRALPAMPQTLEVTATHPLLDSMGGLLRDFLVAIERLDPPYQAHDDYDEPGDDHGLAALQADLLHDRVSATTDDTVRFHGCHGPARQVQVLRDVLLGCFEDDPTLQPRDVLVMTPDIETFGPLVHATFADGLPWDQRHRHPGGLPAVPYRIADRGARTANPVAAALLGAVRVLQSRFEASDLLDLLAMPAVRQHFDIDAEEWPQIRSWVHEAGARWGADAAHRRDESMPDTDGFTWRFALDRLLLGQAVSDRDALIYDSAPLGDIEGRETRTLLGGLVDYVEALLAHRSLVDGEHPLPVWRDRLFTLVASLVGAAGWQVQAVRDGINGMCEAAADAGFDGDLDLASVRTLLEGRFTLSEPGRGYLSGGITFCQLVPMRSVPFRVVCLLGMDDGAFPRVSVQAGFDRIAAHPLLGDRSPRHDDRALFLESILSARDRLEVFFTGRGVRDNQPRPPAVPVGELLDLLDAPVIEHPLQSFSPRPFEGQPTGFDKRHHKAAVAWLSSRSAPVPELPFLSRPVPPQDASDSLELRNLVRFLHSPIKWFCERRLGVWLREEEDPVADREPTEPPDPLQRWQLLDQLVRMHLAGTALDDQTKRLFRRRALLPLGTPGDLLWTELVAQAQGILSDYRKQLGTEVPVSLDVRIDAGLLVTGRLTGVVPAGRVAWRAGRVRAKYSLGLWVRHLALAASGHLGESHLIGRESRVGFGPVSTSDAQHWLGQLVELYKVGQTAPLLFFPKTSAALHRGGNKAAARSWGGYDEPDDYAKWVLAGRMPFDGDLGLLPVPKNHEPQALARIVCGPLLKNQLR